MNARIISIILILGVVAILAIILFDYLSQKPDKRPANPFVENIDEFLTVDPDLISHRETKQIAIKEGTPVDIVYVNGQIILLTEEFIQAIDSNGKEVFRKSLDKTPRCIAKGFKEKLLIGFDNELVAVDMQGDIVSRSETGSGSSSFTAIAVSNGHVFVADAGTRQVQVYNQELQKTDSFKGVSGVSEQHGFILPNLRFDLAVNIHNQLWVVNPGIHALQNYSPDGRLHGYWNRSSFDINGFSGCCNPCRIAFLSDGSIVTSEKGLVRIKIHKESGELSSVVAPPAKFPNGRRAPALAVDENDNIIILDFDRMLIRFFQPEEKP